MEKNNIKSIADFNDYILETAHFKDDIINDTVCKYRFPNNYGIILAYHAKKSDSKYSVDFINYDYKDDNKESYITIDKYENQYNSLDVTNDVDLHDIFEYIFSLPIHIKVTLEVKQALESLSKLNDDEFTFVIQSCRLNRDNNNKDLEN